MANQATTDSTVSQPSAGSNSTSIPNSFSQSDMNGTSTNVKNKMNMFNNMIVKYKQLDSANQQLSIDNATLTVQLTNSQQELEKLTQQNKELDSLLQDARAKESPITVITSPSGCTVLIVLILAITAIALKKGFSISKGDAKVSVGGEEKK